MKKCHFRKWTLQIGTFKSAKWSISEVVAWGDECHQYAPLVGALSMRLSMRPRENPRELGLVGAGFALVAERRACLGGGCWLCWMKAWFLRSKNKVPLTFVYCKFN